MSEPKQLLHQLTEQERWDAYNSGYLPFIENGIGVLKKVTLEEWLDKIKKLAEFGEHQEPYTYSRFPSDYHKREYLASIASRPLEEIKWLIKHFLPAELYGYDEMEKALGRARNILNHKTPYGEDLIKVRYVTRRWAIWALTDGKLASSPRETINWVLDLVDDEPEDAIRVLDAYFSVHCQDLPDGAMDSIEDCTDLIRARYSLFSIPEDLIASLSSREFEYLVERLYDKMGYDTILTPRTHDKGKDVIASKKTKGLKTEILIEAKHSRRTIGVDIIRQLQGVVARTDASKGVIITTSRFSREALEEEKNDRRLELIALEDLVELMNRYFGINWTRYLSIYLTESKRLHEKS